MRRQLLNRFFTLTCCIYVALSFCAQPAWAHALLVKYDILGDKVEIRAKFDDGTEARQAKATVHDADDHTVAQGKTDAKGVWSFAKPQPGTYRITVDAGGGHVESVPFRIGDPAQPEEIAPTSGTNREPDTTASRGLKIGIGIGVIALLGLALLVASRQRRKKNGPSC